MAKQAPYVEIYDPAGRLLEMAHDGCARHSTAAELDMLERGYTIRINGKKLTKKELKEKSDEMQ